MANMIGDERPLVARSKISRNGAEDSYINWIKRKGFKPKDFDPACGLDQLKGFYVPFWLFEISATSDWQGGYYQTHYRTVTKSRYNFELKRNVDYVDSEPYDVWVPMQGTHEKDYRILIPASEYVTHAEIENWPFKTSELKEYDPAYLDEWDVVDATVNYDDAVDICNRRIGDLEHTECKALVSKLTYYNPKSTFNFSNLVLLPLYGLNYTYRDESYRNLINGLTGEIQGSTPSIKPDVLLRVSAIIVALVVALMVLQRLFL